MDALYQTPLKPQHPKLIANTHSTQVQFNGDFQNEDEQSLELYSLSSEEEGVVLSEEEIVQMNQKNELMRESIELKLKELKGLTNWRRSWSIHQVELPQNTGNSARDRRKGCSSGDILGQLLMLETELTDSRREITQYRSLVMEKEQQNFDIQLKIQEIEGQEAEKRVYCMCVLM